MRTLLDRLYRGTGIVAGFFLVMIAVMALIQIFGRLLGYAVHSFDEFAGYCMATSAFLGLAWTLRTNEHIRVTLLLGHARGGARRALELLCLALATALVGFFAWHVLSMVWLSYTLNDVSQGLVPVKLWIPQGAMAIGIVVLLIALVDDLLAVLCGRPPSYDSATADGGPAFER